MLQSNLKTLLAKGDIENTIVLLRETMTKDNEWKDEIIKISQRFFSFKKLIKTYTKEEQEIRRNQYVDDILALINEMPDDAASPENTNTANRVLAKAETYAPMIKTPLSILVGVEVVLGIWIGFLGEWFPDSLKTAIADYFGANYPQVYLAVLAVSILLLLWVVLKKEDNSIADNILPPPTDAERLGFIRDLRERYQTRLKSKLDTRLPISLDLSFTQQGMTQPYVERFFDGEAQTDAAVQGSLRTVVATHKHLLLLGDAGGGKTTLLLQTALAHISENVNDTIPLIVNLATWHDADARFDDWLVQYLVSGFGFPAQFARTELSENRFFLLFDGLDEIAYSFDNENDKIALRRSCLTALEVFVNLYELSHFLIASREKEYLALRYYAPVRADILLQSITIEKLKATFAAEIDKKQVTRNDTAARNLNYLIDPHPVLAEVLQNPFYFNIALDVFDLVNIPNDLPDDKAALCHYLETEFINKKLAYTKNEYGFSDEKTRHYLAWLAKWLDKKNEVRFELADFQPSLLKQPWFMKVIYSVLVGGILTLSLSLFLITLNLFNLFNFFLVSIVGVLFGLLLGSLLGLMVVLLGINTEDGRVANFSKLFLYSTWKSLCRVFFIFGLIMGLTGLLINNFNHGLYFGCIFGCIFAIVVDLPQSLSDFPHLLNIQSPYQRLKSNCLFTVLQYFFTGVLCTICIRYFFENSQIQVIHSVIMGGLTGGLKGSLTPLFSHFLLRICFYLEGSMPLQYVRFLEYAHAARLIEKEGGHFRFRHQILQAYFANTKN